jgi:hypothetical protein
LSADGICHTWTIKHGILRFMYVASVVFKTASEVTAFGALWDRRQKEPTSAMRTGQG